MINPKKFLSLFFLIFLIGDAFAAPGLQVEIVLHQSSARNGDIIPVNTKLKNPGPGTVSIFIWSCAYNEHWVADNTSVDVEAISCDKNILKQVDIQPGETYEKSLYVMITVPAQEVSVENLTFRLGFKSALDKSGQGFREVVWSEPVTVKVGD